MVADAGAVDGGLTGAPFAAAGKTPEEKISGLTTMAGVGAAGALVHGGLQMHHNNFRAGRHDEHSQIRDSLAQWHGAGHWAGVVVQRLVARDGYSGDADVSGNDGSGGSVA